MKIVNVFQIHYFLYWGSISGVLNYSILFITNYGSVTQKETGILYGILPLAIMFAKPFFCSLSDKYAIHEWVLIGSIVGQIFSYGVMVPLAFVVEQNIVWYVFCVIMLFGNIFTGVLTSMTDSVVMKIADTEKSNFGQMRVWGTIGWGLISLLIGQINDKKSSLNPFRNWPIYTPGLVLFIVMQVMDLILMLSHKNKLRAACKSLEMEQKHRLTLEETIEQSICRSANVHHSLEDQLERNKMNSQSISNYSNDQMVESKKFDEHHLSTKESKVTEKKENKKQITKFVFLTCCSHPMLMKYVFICIVVGVCTALNWNYFSLFLDELKGKEKGSTLIGYAASVQCFASEMPFMYFSGYFIDKIGSKASFNIVLFVFALRYFLYTFFTTQTATYILFVELTHGITFGLFYYTMNILSREYSKKMCRIESNYLIEQAFKRRDQSVEGGQSMTLEDFKKTINLPEDDDSTFSTMQGIMSGSFEGLGVALGSFLGGLVIAKHGFKFLWYCFSAIAFIIFALDLLLMFIIYLRHKFSPSNKST